MLYDKYTNRIKNILETKRRKNFFEKGVQLNAIGDVNNLAQSLLQEQRTFGNTMQLETQPLNSLLQRSDLSRARLGHPDFDHLKFTENFEYHNIVSVFIDIKGSTNLFDVYDLEDIFMITNTVQTAAIQTCMAMGGHIQRLQGDGIFAYFGGKNINKKVAVECAVTASSLFTYFIKNDLRNIFSEEEIDDISTRIGIDFGEDKDVLWANFGIQHVSELTTLSLHTSLANKMQANAGANGIVVGQHVRDLLEAGDQLYDYVRDPTSKEVKRFILEKKKSRNHYAQYSFDWYSYLKALPNIGVNPDGTLFIQTDDHERLARLRKTAGLLTSGDAYLSREGKINDNPAGVKHEPHQFHYGK